MTELENINSESKEIVNSQESSQEEFKQSVAALLFAFKELVEDGQWMSVNGNVDGQKFCVAVGVNETGIKMHELMIENFTDGE